MLDGEQASDAYENPYYPVIYGQEKLSVINGTEKENGLDLSDQSSFIERNAGTSTSSYIGAVTTANSIQPYNTDYDVDIVPGGYFENYSDEGNYQDLIMPNGESTYYWIASRCVKASGYSVFGIRMIGGGRITSHDVFLSNGNASGTSAPLFPIVTLSSNLISGNSESGFSVK